MKAYRHCNLIIPRGYTTIEQTYFLAYIERLPLRKTIRIYIYLFFEGYQLNKIVKDADTDSMIGLIRNMDDTKHEEKFLDHSNLIYLKDGQNGIRIAELIIDNTKVNIKSDLYVNYILYNFKSVLKSEEFLINHEKVNAVGDLCKSDIFTNLTNIVFWYNCKKSRIVTQKPQKSYDLPDVSVTYDKLKCSACYVQISIFLTSIFWISKTIKQEKRVSVKVGNLMTALAIDIIVGVFILHYITEWSSRADLVKDWVEGIVDHLRSLLHWLMGSPAGLKLNHAFNNMLGKFFIYHTNLWWMFIEISMEPFGAILITLHYLGYLGLTFQAAILSDVLAVTSFHVYCIYIYAARLYSIQVSGLVALFRLFLGRKHNPLRGVVDSCEYTHQELFVGTLAFTILLFLLPSTAMYYIVFTLIRVLILTVQGCLTTICYFMKTLPVYVTFLWLVRSQKIASIASIEIVHPVKDYRSLNFNLEFKHRPLAQIINAYQPTTVPTPEPIQWGKLVSDLWRGNLVYPM